MRQISLTITGQTWAAPAQVSLMAHGHITVEDFITPDEYRYRRNGLTILASMPPNQTMTTVYMAGDLPEHKQAMVIWAQDWKSLHCECSLVVPTTDGPRDSAKLARAGITSGMIYENGLEEVTLSSGNRSARHVLDLVLRGELLPYVKRKLKPLGLPRNAMDLYK